MSPWALRNEYGKGGTIDSMKPFTLEASVDDEGALMVQLHQGPLVSRTSITVFNRHMAGNPQGHGLPPRANGETSHRPRTLERGRRR